MIGSVLLCLGGLGLFLLGMTVLTDGLRALAGRALRRLLSRFTRSPLSGAMTGAVTTAVVQSSSATTVAAVGFVGAGLLTFPQALGIVLGANVGTTMTGWLVALLGFKLELGTAAMPDRAGRRTHSPLRARSCFGGRLRSGGFRPDLRRHLALATRHGWFRRHPYARELSRRHLDRAAAPRRIRHRLHDPDAIL